MKKFVGSLLIFSSFIVPSTFAQRRELKHDAVPTRERRVALVIGNSAYAVNPLRNPVNDAREVARALREKELDFDEVIQRENLSQKEMERAVRGFGAKLGPSDIGLFYYAGHGVQINEENYLVPVDAAPRSEEELEDSAIKVSNVLRRMERDGDGINIMILDACRNNSFPRSFRSASDGLAVMDANESSTDTFIAFAAAAGQVASDGGSSGNGVFTQELLRHMQTRGLTIDQMFRRVTEGVFNRTRKKQRPWTSSSLTREFYFAQPSNSGPEKMATSAAPVEAAPSRQDMARNLYNSGQAAESPLLRDFSSIAPSKLTSPLEVSGGNFSEAATLYRQAVKLDPTNALYQNALGRALIKVYEGEYKEWDRRRITEEVRVGQINQAEMEKWWGRPGYKPPPQMARPLIESAPAFPGEATAALRKAVGLEPGNATYRAELIDAWHKYGVEPPPQRLAEYSPLSSRDSVVLPPALSSIELPKVDTEADVREVLSLEPNNPKLHVVLASVLAGKEKWAEAEAEYREAIRLEPQNVQHHTKLAELFGRQQKWAEAVTAYRQAVLLAPNDKTLKKSLEQAVKNRKKYKQ